MPSFVFESDEELFMCGDITTTMISETKTPSKSSSNLCVLVGQKEKEEKDVKKATKESNTERMNETDSENDLVKRAKFSTHHLNKWNHFNSKKYDKKEYVEGSQPGQWRKETPNNKETGKTAFTLNYNRKETEPDVERGGCGQVYWWGKGADGTTTTVNRAISLVDKLQMYVQDANDFESRQDGNGKDKSKANAVSSDGGSNSDTNAGRAVSTNDMVSAVAKKYGIPLNSIGDAFNQTMEMNRWEYSKQFSSLPTGKHEEKTNRKTKQQKEIALIRANVGSGAWNLSLIKKQCNVIDIIQQTSVSSEQSSRMQLFASLYSGVEYEDGTNSIETNPKNTIDNHRGENIKINNDAIKTNTNLSQETARLVLNDQDIFQFGYGLNHCYNVHNKKHVTNRTPTFTDTLDYIFLNKKGLKCIRTVPVAEIFGQANESITCSTKNITIPMLPCQKWPSDHLMLLAEVDYV